MCLQDGTPLVKEQQLAAGIRLRPHGNKGKSLSYRFRAYHQGKVLCGGEVLPLGEGAKSRVLAVAMDIAVKLKGVSRRTLEPLSAPEATLLLHFNGSS